MEIDVINEIEAEPPEEYYQLIVFGITAVEGVECTDVRNVRGDEQE